MFLVDWFIVLRAQFKVDWKPQKKTKKGCNTLFSAALKAIGQLYITIRL